MADSDEIVGQRQTFYVGDVNYKTALSEALMRKVASAINYVNGRTAIVYPIHWGGYFRPRPINVYSEPTIFVLKDASISWYSLTVGQTGSVGNNSCNFQVIDETGAVLGNLFNSPPLITQSGLSTPTVGRDFEDNSTIQQVTTSGFDVGTINPAYETLLGGWKLRPYIVGNATNSLGMTMTIALNIRE